MRFTITFLIFFYCTLTGFSQITQWEVRGIGGGGALFSPSISPFNNQEIFMPCDMTELFHTTDQGETWDMVHFSEIVPWKHSKVQYTADPNILYAVAFDFALDLTMPAKSFDGGETWNFITDPTGGGAYTILADADDTDRLLLSAYSSLYFSNDGGNSWNNVYAASDLYIGGAFWDGPNIYVGCRTGLLVSTDNGNSFAIVNYTGYPTGQGFLSFTGAEEGGVTRLVGCLRGNTDMWPGMPANEYWDSQDIYTITFGAGTPSWAVSSTGIPTAAFPFFVDMAQNDIDVIYTAGASEWPSHPLVYKTTDGGANWGSVFNTANNGNITTGWMGDSGDLNWGWAENAMGFDVSATDPNTLVISDWGFGHISNDGGSSWQQAYVNEDDENTMGALTPQKAYYQGNGLENTSSWWVHWVDADNIFAGYSDVTAIKSVDGGTEWSYDYNGISYNSVYHVVEAPDGSLYAAVSSVHDVYQTTYLRDNNLNGSGAILKSIDGGANWTMFHDFSNIVMWLALDPNDTNVMYASVLDGASGGIYKTTNLTAATPIFSMVNAPPRSEARPFNIHVLNDGTVVASYSARRNSGGAFTASSGIFVSTNGGLTWADRSDSSMHYYTKDITIDPHDPSQNTWYVGVFSGWGGPPNGLGGLYKTTDRGMNWTKILSLDRVESCTIDPNDADKMYVTSEYEGLWFTDNLTDANPTFNLEMGYKFQHPTRVFFNPYADEVWVTSFGHGMAVSNICTNILTLNGGLSSPIYKSNLLIETQGVTTSGSSVRLISNEIELNTDFEVPNTNILNIENGDCNTN